MFRRPWRNDRQFLIADLQAPAACAGKSSVIDRVHVFQDLVEQLRRQCLQKVSRRVTRGHGLCCDHCGDRGDDAQSVLMVKVLDMGETDDVQELVKEEMVTTTPDTDTNLVVCEVLRAAATL